MNTDIKDNKPMMSDKEIQIIDDLLQKLKPQHCLEWGSGNSTVYFSKRSSIKSWLAIEHDGNILDYLQNKLPQKVQTVWILEGDSYADCVQRSHRKYDFILIDGLDREKCLQNALKIVSPNGFILLHDAGREEYQGMIKKYKGEKLCDGEIPEGEYYAHRGLAIFRSSNGPS